MGAFVTFEGPEGSGKTTQIQLLHDSLTMQGLSVVRTREPGGTSIGEQIRPLLHDFYSATIAPVTEALLYSADRAQHVIEVVRPALARGQVVISDRYAESTLAYQGYGHGLELDGLCALTALATGGLSPDLIVYLDLEVTIGLARKRRDQHEGQGEWNRMDQQDLAFHQRVREGYLAMAQSDKSRWLVIDATQPVEAIQRAVLRRVMTLLR